MPFTRLVVPSTDDAAIVQVTDPADVRHGVDVYKRQTSTTMTITALSSDGTTALADGVTYDVELRAVNAAGSGPGSAVATGIPVTVPAAPVSYTHLPTPDGRTVPRRCAR